MSVTWRIVWVVCLDEGTLTTYQPAASRCGSWNHEKLPSLSGRNVASNDATSGRPFVGTTGGNDPSAHSGNDLTCRYAATAPSRSGSRWTTIRTVVGGFDSCSSSPLLEPQSANVGRSDVADSTRSSVNRYLGVALTAPCVSNRKRWSD